MKAERKVSREVLLLRLLWTLAFVAVWGMAEAVLVMVIIGQWLLRVVNGEPSVVVARFGDSLSRYMAEIGRFACFHSHCKPWPFSDWPAARDPAWEDGMGDLPPKSAARESKA